MLSFDTALTDSLKLGNTTSFWVLKLYYNAEGSSDFIGVSEQDRSDGSDFYHGIVASWGEYQQSLDFFNFTTSTGNMTVNLINTDNSIQGGRFTDLFSTYNFANRKWELFQNTSQTSTYDTSARMIAQGVISGDINYDTKQVSLTLLDLNDEYHEQIPKAVIQNTESGEDYYYPNAPEKNINKPIPMAYGDFHDKTGIGTIPTSTCEFDRYFTKGQFPAVITDEWDQTNGYIEAKPDSVAIHSLDTKNVYMYKDGYYSPCEDSNVTVANPLITFSDNIWRVYNTLHSTANSDAIDNNFNTGTTSDQTTAPLWEVSMGFSINKIPNLGKINTGIHDIFLLIDYGAFQTSGVDFWRVNVNGTQINLANFDSVSIEKVNITSAFSSAEISAWDFECSVTFELNDETSEDGGQFTINEIGLEVEFTPSQTFEKQIQEQYISSNYAGIGSAYVETNSIPDFVYRTRSVTKITPSIADYIYYSGKGRKYGSWITGRSSTYTTSSYIENPVYIIEDMIRTELGQTNIDTTSFDASGDYNTGELGDIFNDAVRDIQFAMSQYKFINSKDFIEKIGQQCLSWVFLSGDGNFKIRTLRRDGDYTSSDATIDYRQIKLNSISRTQLGAVRNDITINYNHDYGQDQNLGHSNTTDATSQGTGVNGVGKELKLELDVDSIIDSTTADQLADAYLHVFKDRKPIVDFTCTTPKYNELEITDIIDFTNWDSNIDIYGTAMGGYWMITNISKSIKSTKIKAIKVST